ncbi:hypothetical protein [Bradyrhizobium sp. 192]|uniref:hypothetical protein n=1 Tax=Bradyrhizobium sp. 192 TaxID=2782660 RepID=UPI001FFFE56D|nr:hypothetical protein [Bradyrhizobium sp. 192]UPJ55389.1 hypothetical protein IVB24_22280 [Bradyrhizobium sp. 192]
MNAAAGRAVEPLVKAVGQRDLVGQRMLDVHPSVRTVDKNRACHGWTLSPGQCSRQLRAIPEVAGKELALIVGTQVLDREQLDLGTGANDGFSDAAGSAVFERAGDRSGAAAQAAGGDEDGRSQKTSMVTLP